MPITFPHKPRKGAPLGALSDRLAAIPRGCCRTGEFYEQLDDADRAAFDAWVADGRPMSELHRQCEVDGLVISKKAFRDHINNHHRAEALEGG